MGILFQRSDNFLGYELKCGACGLLIYTFSNEWVTWHANGEEGKRYILQLASDHESGCKASVNLVGEGVRWVKVNRREK